MINKNKPGFTLAELLITILIMTILAGSLVPMLGKTRLKKHATKDSFSHGIVECFWYGDKVYLWQQDNVLNPIGKFEPQSSNYCRVTLPQANMYQFTAIGAGGKGSDSTPAYTKNTSQKSGTVRTDENFANDMKKVPDAVKDFWNVRFATYIVESPVAGGGNCLCEDYQAVNEEKCRPCTIAGITGDCLPECLDQVCANGGESGKGYSYRVNFPLRADSNVNKTLSVNKAGVKVDDNYFYLKSATAGESAKKQNGIPRDGGKGKDAEIDSNLGEKVIENGRGYFDKQETVVHMGCNHYSNQDAQSRSAGSVDMSQKISYTYYSPNVTFKYAPSGSPGAKKSQIFEKILNKSLTLYPGRRVSTTNNIPSRISYWTLQIDSSEDLPCPKSIIDSATVSNDEYAVGPGLNSKIKEKGLNPGKAGNGSYPLVADDDEQTTENQITITDIQGTAHSSKQIQNFPKSNIASYQCEGGTYKYTTNGKTVCKANSTAGSDGAIVITW